MLAKTIATLCLTLAAASLGACASQPRDGYGRGPGDGGGPRMAWNHGPCADWRPPQQNFTRPERRDGMPGPQGPGAMGPGFRPPHPPHGPMAMGPMRRGPMMMDGPMGPRAQRGGFGPGPRGPEGMRHRRGPMGPRGDRPEDDRRGDGPRGMGPGDERQDGARDPMNRDGGDRRAGRGARPDGPRGGPPPAPAAPDQGTQPEPRR